VRDTDGEINRNISAQVCAVRSFSIHSSSSIQIAWWLKCRKRKLNRDNQALKQNKHFHEPEMKLKHKALSRMKLSANSPLGFQVQKPRFLSRAGDRNERCFKRGRGQKPDLARESRSWWKKAENNGCHPLPREAEGQRRSLGTRNQAKQLTMWWFWGTPSITMGEAEASKRPTLDLIQERRSGDASGGKNY
jgi:hypothetical protein